MTPEVAGVSGPAFIAKRFNLPWERELARPVIAVAASAAAAAAAVPVPVADAAILAPIQFEMMVRIATIYDLELKVMLSTGALTTGRARHRAGACAQLPQADLGRWHVIGASVAFALTPATGDAWMRLCEHVHTGNLDFAMVADWWGDYTPGVLDLNRDMAAQRIAKP